MKSTTLAFVLLLIGLCGHAAELEFDDLKLIYGVWKVESATTDGKVIADAPVEFDFTADKFTIRDKKNTLEKFSFTLNPSSKPKTLLARPGKSIPNREPGKLAYEFVWDTFGGILTTGNTLMIAMIPPDKQPTDVSDKGQKLFILKRKKP